MKPIFRNSMFGFHKEDVSSFIAKQSKQYEKRIAELVESEQKLEAQLSEERALRESNLDELQALREESDRRKLDSAQVREILAKLDSQKDALLSGVDSCSDHFDQMKEGIGELNRELTTALSFRDKAKKFDQLANVLSGILSGEVRTSEEDHTTEEKMEKVQEIAFNNESIKAQKEAVLRVAELLKELHQFFGESAE